MASVTGSLPPANILTIMRAPDMANPAGPAKLANFATVVVAF